MQDSKKSTKIILNNDEIIITGYQDEYIFEKINSSHKFYEQHILDSWVLPLKTEIKVIYDIGANIGNHTVYFGKCMDADSIISFEPLVRNYELLCENISNNHLSNIKAFNFALGETNGNATMEIAQAGNYGTAQIVNDSQVGTEIVMKSLDTLEDIPLPDFIKIDVEGYELPVLKGMKNILMKASPILWIEVGLETASDVCEFLEELGYMVSTYNLDADNNVIFKKYNNSRNKSGELFSSIIKLAVEKRTLGYDVRKFESKYVYEQKKAEELYKALQKKTSQFIYEQQKAEELYKDLQKRTSQFIYEQKKAEELYKDLQRKNSQFIYEQNRAEEFYKALQKKTSQFIYEQQKAEEFNKDLQEKTSQFLFEQQKAEQLHNDLQKKTSQFLYEQQLVETQKLEIEEVNSRYIFEQNKARKLESKVAVLNSQLDDLKIEKDAVSAKLEEEIKKHKKLQIRMEAYQKAKLFRLMLFVWKTRSRFKFRIRCKVNKFGKYVYYKVLPYPKLKNFLAKVNRKLRIFPDPEAVVNRTNDKPVVWKNNKWNSVKKPKDFNVAVIVDEFTYNSFKYECNTFVLYPDNWRSIFEQNEIDFFFCESAWSGPDSVNRPWKGKIYSSINFNKENRTILLEILEYCKKNNIPTVFWNKEDPTHYEDKVHNFVDTALLFNHLFTTSKECVNRYKNDYGHKSAHLLMFGTQPRLFNPIEKYERSEEIVFAGSWYKQHEARSEEMEIIFDDIIDSGYQLKIYNRHSDYDDPNHVFPERYNQYILPRLNHEELEIAYKGSKYSLNINTVLDSSTMFARRVFELLSSNTLVLSNYSKGIEELFGDIVTFVGNGRSLQPIDNVEEKRNQGLYNVLKHHTYKTRFKQILEDCQFSFLDDSEKVALFYFVTDDESAKEALKNFNTINIDNKTAIFLINAESKVLRKNLVLYNGSNVQVVDLKYCQKQKVNFGIQDNYLILANEHTTSEFIEKALLHMAYLNEDTGVCDSNRSFKIENAKIAANILYPYSAYEKFFNKLVHDKEELMNTLLI